MLLKGDVKSNKFNLLVDKYSEIINSGVSTSDILVILQTPSDKSKFIDSALQKINNLVIEKLNIHTFHGLIYNTISENWIFLENSIPSKKHKILPNLVGLEVSQLILKDILKLISLKGYNSKISLLHQIFRRYSLILQNSLTEKEIKEKMEILKESFGDDAQKIIKELLSKTLQYRSFDYLRQIPLFMYIYQNTKYFDNVKYIFIDDIDEMPPVVFDFLEHIKNNKQFFIGFDSPGNSRMGYLAAATDFETRLYKLFNERPTEIDSVSNEDAKNIYKNISDNEQNILKNMQYKSLSKRSEIIHDCINKIKDLLSEGIKPTEISIVSPIIDNILKSSLESELKNINFQYISGSEKLIDNSIIKSIINILKLTINIPITEFELRGILYNFLDIQIKDCKKIIKTYLSKQEFVNNFYDEKYLKFIEVLDYLKQNNLSLSKKIYYIYQSLISKISPENLKKVSFLLKQIQDFEKVFSVEEIEKRAEDIIIQLENSIISERPYSVINVGENDLIVSTPQKIIDNKIITKYQIWLDVSSNEWIKSDNGPLYNSWVFQKNWTKSEYTIEDEIKLSDQKNAKIMRKLTLCTDYVFAYSSLFDSQGVENFGGIEKYLITETTNTEEKNKIKITPRKDQKPVLDYENGKMAISAVPGAGKTTILLLLIMKLIEKEKPENIFVLTYMESAARNFKERIKKLGSENTKLPSITTIHGLALRIIKENSNYERLGLDSDFEICDDSLKMRIISSVAGSVSKDDVDDFTRAISVLKFSGIKKDKLQDIISDTKKYKLHPKVSAFLKFFERYQNKLKENNIIDYDDILAYSVQLLEENPDILNYYQEQCKYIIEDEAQDSSSVQQKLLNLLSGKYKNIIRCGDINQAITTTFTNADVEGFRNFIEQSNNVKMDCSQRCTEDVWKLANDLVKWGEIVLKGAFYNMMMQPVEGRNPVEKNAVVMRVFDKSEEERNYILREIKNQLSVKKDATIGILLRNNYQVAEWENFINNAGFKVISRTESLGRKSIFKTILAVLKAIEKPFKNSVLAETYKTLYEQGFYKRNLSEKIKNYETDFITTNPDDDEELSNYIWDMNYWLNSSNIPLSELVSKIGLYYYHTDIEISNVYLITILVERLNVKNDLSLLIERLKELAKRPSLSGFKFFDESDSDKEQAGTIQIMTLHKSKGDEFDYVFIPELTEKNLSLDISKIFLHSSSKFMENVKCLNPDYKKRDETEIKKFIIAENMRLLYVAITRAKRKLYITMPESSKAFGRLQKNDVNIIFESLKK